MAKTKCVYVVIVDVNQKPKYEIEFRTECDAKAEFDRIQKQRAILGVGTIILEDGRTVDGDAFNYQTVSKVSITDVRVVDREISKEADCGCD